MPSLAADLVIIDVKYLRFEALLKKGGSRITLGRGPKRCVAPPLVRAAILSGKHGNPKQP